MAIPSLLSDAAALDIRRRGRAAGRLRSETEEGRRAAPPGARLAARHEGTVYAADVEPEMMKYLGERAKREGLKNLRPVVASADDARLPVKVDLILLVDVYHHIENRERYFRKLAASLKPGGRLAVIDFRLDSPEGPPKEARIPPEKVKAELSAAGYAPVAEHGFLPRQYFLVFAPAR